MRPFQESVSGAPKESSGIRSRSHFCKRVIFYASAKSLFFGLRVVYLPCVGTNDLADEAGDSVPPCGEVRIFAFYPKSLTFAAILKDP